MRLKRSTWLSVPLAVALLFVGEGAAWAYPQFQLSTSNSLCSSCHVSPAGGGLLTEYGRYEAGETISRGGNGGLLHGAVELPDWLSLGGDFRGALAVKDAGAAETDLLYFPMQADLYAGVFLPAGFALVATGGLRGSARNTDSDRAPKVGSREHYLLWKPEAKGSYLRAGRFYAPYGLRLADHTTYVRRALGYYAWEETYGLSYGYLQDAWELHITAFADDPWVDVGRRDDGGAVYFERRALGETLAVGVQGRVGIGDETDRYTGGLVGKYWAESLDLLIVAELDAIYENFDADASPERWQLLGHLGLSYFPTRGVLLGGTYERYDRDVGLTKTETDAMSLSAQWFPIAHLEIALLGRFERAGGGNDTALGLLMLHYYL